MAKLKLAVNGFGRIGRLTVRILKKHYPDVDIVAVNDLTDAPTLAHLFKYDTAHGRFAGEVSVESEGIRIQGDLIKVFAEKDPSSLPWKDLGVDIVLESTGKFTEKEKAELHLKAGAGRVIISAPAKGDIKTIVLGVNDHMLTKEDRIVSNASCTTNCLAPMVKVLDDAFGVEYGLMTTTHAFTADQRLQDAPHKDLRRARAASHNIVPTSTGAASAVGKVLTHLKGKLHGTAMRVPTITGSVTEFNAIVKNVPTAEQVNAAFRNAAEGALKGILKYTEEPIVSSDIIGDPHSCIFDAGLTMVMHSMVRVTGWYDNEAGYSHRIADLIVRLGQA
ncbi:MAG: glyceraldehyde-3-phosphate dehydrogenase [Chitinophagales bacterium]|nr:MAG: glyceraldehyde-3-phosphate dehydrogenase [Chitinophagales bacterium]